MISPISTTNDVLSSRLLGRDEGERERERERGRAEGDSAYGPPSLLPSLSPPLPLLLALSLLHTGDFPGWGSGRITTLAAPSFLMNEGIKLLEKYFERIKCWSATRSASVPGEAIGFEREREKWADWQSIYMRPILPVSPVPVRSLLRLPGSIVAGVSR